MTEPDQNDLPATPSRITRNGFNHWMVALLWLIIVALPLQAVIAIIAIPVMGAFGLIDLGQSMDLTALTENLTVLMGVNSAWQILGLGLGTVGVAALHVHSGSSRTQFLRLKKVARPIEAIAIAILLTISIQPVVWLLGWLNSLIPTPDFFAQMQQSQMELIQRFLSSEQSVLIALFNIALVPGICEELLFRGYVMRTFEKERSISVAIIASSLIFGLFHLQLSNLLPLATIGGVLAILAWRTSSLIPAIVMHFLNNASAVVAVVYFPDSEFASMAPDQAPPLLLVLAGLLVSLGLMRYLFIRYKPEV